MLLLVETVQSSCVCKTQWCQSNRQVHHFVRASELLNRSVWVEKTVFELRGVMMSW